MRLNLKVTIIISLSLGWKEVKKNDLLKKNYWPKISKRFGIHR